MSNHNILITDPKGVRKLHFVENVSRDDCREWLEEYGPAPIGWMYQITNLNRKKRVLPKCILLTGFSKNGEFVAQTKARHKTNNGWYSVKMAKRDLRRQGASWFRQEKVWSNSDGSDKVEL